MPRWLLVLLLFAAAGLLPSTWAAEVGGSACGLGPGNPARMHLGITPTAWPCASGPNERVHQGTEADGLNLYHGYMGPNSTDPEGTFALDPVSLFYAGAGLYGNAVDAGMNADGSSRAPGQMLAGKVMMGVSTAAIGVAVGAVAAPVVAPLGLWGVGVAGAVEGGLFGAGYAYADGGDAGEVGMGAIEGAGFGVATAGIATGVAAGVRAGFRAVRPAPILAAARPVPGSGNRMVATDDRVFGLSRRMAEEASNKCFLAGTAIAIEGGTTKPIESIHPGDLVLSKDEVTGTEGYKPVVQTFVTHPEVLVHVTFEGVDGATSPTYRASSEVVGTPEHPIWRLDTGWVPMGTLAVGDVVRCSDGRTARVGKLWSERAPEGQTFTTYNFEVADWHTYFVQAGEGAVWVHNTCPGRGQSDELVRFKRWKRGDAIDKPMPDGSEASWETVQSRYWKNRYDGARHTGEFTPSQMAAMRKGNAPMDYDPISGQWAPRELHHVVAQRYGGRNTPLNLRELTPKWHAEVDPFRKIPGIVPNRGIR